MWARLADLEFQASRELEALGDPGRAIEALGAAARSRIRSLKPRDKRDGVATHALVRISVAAGTPWAAIMAKHLEARRSSDPETAANAKKVLDPQDMRYLGRADRASPPRVAAVDAVHCWLPVIQEWAKAWMLSALVSEGAEAMDGDLRSKTCMSHMSYDRDAFLLTHLAAHAADTEAECVLRWMGAPTAAKRAKRIVRGVPAGEALLAAVPESAGAAAWAAPSSAFPALAKLVAADDDSRGLATYRRSLLEGFVVSAGGVGDSLGKAAGGALVAALRDDPELQRDVFKTLVAILDERAGVDRVTTPLLRALDACFSAGCLGAVAPAPPAPPAPLAAALAAKLRAELKGSRDVAKLCLGVQALCHLAGLGKAGAGPAHDEATCASTCATMGVLALLVNRYPRVRRVAAEQLYVTLLGCEGEDAGPEEAIELLSQMTVRPQHITGEARASLGKSEYQKCVAPGSKPSSKYEVSDDAEWKQDLVFMENRMSFPAVTAYNDSKALLMGVGCEVPPPNVFQETSLCTDPETREFCNSDCAMPFPENCAPGARDFGSCEPTVVGICDNIITSRQMCHAVKHHVVAAVDRYDAIEVGALPCRTEPDAPFAKAAYAQMKYESAYVDWVNARNEAT